MDRGGIRRPYGRPWYRNRGRGTPRGGARPSADAPPAPPVVLRETGDEMKGWNLYFYGDENEEGPDTVRKVMAFVEFLETMIDGDMAVDVAKRAFYHIDYSAVVKDEKLNRSVPDLKGVLGSSPELSLKCFGLAVYTVVLARLKGQSVTVPRVNARLVNCEPLLQLRNVKAQLFGKLVTVKGTVVRVSNVKPMARFLAFSCRSCQTESAVLQPDGIYTVPAKCPVPGCRGQNLVPARSSGKTRTVDWQSLRIQEVLEDDQRDWGRVPRTMDCVLTEDLVDSAVPGDSVVLSGIVKVLAGDNGNQRRQDEKSLYNLYIDAISVVNTKRGQTLNRESENESVDFTEEDYEQIQNLHSKPNLFAVLVSSFAPSIFGHEVVKAGLLLALLGGTAAKQGVLQTRSDPHILLVGDPGLGKSQLLQAATLAAPRGVYVCGNTTTKSGLTVTLTREGGNHGDYSLEAGALVLADQGICCIDEFDKMTSQHQALLEAMEQQCVSLAKAGIICSLPARTSVIAAANPHGGHYDKNKSVSENIRLGPALLSRFDMVFILVDRPSDKHDYRISKHIVGLHSKNINTFVPASYVADEVLSGREEFIREKLSSDEPPIPVSLIRKYIAYAKKYVKPVLSDEAKRELQQFYLELRQKAANGGDMTAVTTRQLEALIRLAQARAKAELREEATAADACEVIEILKCSLADTATDEFGNLDMRRSQHGSGMSKANQKRKFLAALQSIAENKKQKVFTTKEMQAVANNLGIDTVRFSDFLNSMNDQGFLLFKGQGKYQLQISDL